MAGPSELFPISTDELVRLRHEATRLSEMPLVSISNDQRRPIANANFVATVHHGIPTNLHTPIYNPRGGYVAFLGRISPEKRPDRAIRIARTLGIPLKIAAKVDKGRHGRHR
jgi:glycosyltransferase involved in cell wall biosynthesis